MTKIHEAIKMATRRGGAVEIADLMGELDDTRALIAEAVALLGEAQRALFLLRYGDAQPSPAPIDDRIAAFLAREAEQK